MNLVTLLLMILAFSFVAVPTAFAPPTDLSHLIVDTIGEPMDLDPAWSYDTASAELLMNVYETLLWFNRTNMDSYVPGLATNWVGTAITEISPEGLQWKNRWTFTIRDNSYFHYHDGSVPGEGAQVTPADVEYTFERILLTDCSTGPAWMIWEPLVAGYWMGDLNDTLADLGVGEFTVWDPLMEGYWNTLCDDVIDHAIESNDTCVWFNLVTSYDHWLQILAQQWGSVLSKEWCLWHDDWHGVFNDTWPAYWGPLSSPLYTSNPSAPGPNLDAALGTGPYMMDYWNKGVGNAWSVIKNPTYWRGWTTPFHPEGWGTEFTINGHVDRFSSYYIPEWSTRKLRFLGGLSDFCAVPKIYMGQLEGLARDASISIEWWLPLPQLSCDTVFFNYDVWDATNHLGVVQAPGIFSAYGAPPDIFADKDLRLGIAHLFDYETYLYTAFPMGCNTSYLDEAISPVTPIIPGLSYYDPTIGKPENPSINQRKEYGTTGELAGQLAYDLNLAKTYLQNAWGGQLWHKGFTMDIAYVEGNLGMLTAATLIKNGLDEINSLYGTRFTMNIVSLPWSTCKIEWRVRCLPLFICSKRGDFPDTHSFAHAFMHSTGAFAKWQGIKGVSSFPNQVVDDHIEAGIATLNPSERAGNYSWLQQYYVDECPGFVLTQATGRHWQRQWVEGWYYNPIYPGTYAYDIWKDIAVTVQDVDVAVTAMTSFAGIEVGLPVPDNPVILPFPSPITVTVTRLDNNAGAHIVDGVIGVGFRNETSEIIIGFGTIWGLGYVGGTFPTTRTLSFYEFEQDPTAPIHPGTYTAFAVVFVQPEWANDINASNNILEQTSVEVGTLPGDVNVDGTIDMADISWDIDEFMTYFCP